MELCCSFNCLPCDSQVIYTLHRASFRDPSVCTHQYSQPYLRRKTSLETPPPSAITSRDACLLSMARRQRHLVKEKRDSHGLSREALKSTFQITLSAAFKKNDHQMVRHQTPSTLTAIGFGYLSLEIRHTGNLKLIRKEE
ncbi:hypothetical protein CEXT_708991 [Caerostris extrusa]|uniref:Uncharacterized protein n=1 Tax=Caerostris extrusa TaxID=172846 RepID=A0AAV4W091_CAEEX|nr:hypothetical protein CEXT_708991 [Caerostris extrusa]